MRIPLAHLLVKSPLPRITTAMERVLACAREVPPMFEHLIEGNQAGVGRIAKEISKLEGLADEAKNEIRADMPLRLFLPVDRRDVLKLLSQIDAIADSAEDVAVLLTLRPMEVPPEMTPLLRQLVAASVAAVETAHELTLTIDSLIASAFGGRAAADARQLIAKVAEKEHAADKLQDQLAKVVFQLEGRLSPVAIYMWMKILEEVGDMANHAENVGDQFRLFLAR